MAAARTRGLRGRPLHARATDEEAWTFGHDPRKACEDNAIRQGGTLSAGQGEPGVRGPGPEPAVGIGLHIRPHLERVRLYGLRDRHLRPAHCRLEGVALGDGRVRSLRAALDALEQALHERRPFAGSGLVHHGDRGVQYLAIAYSERLADADIEPSVGSVGDSYDNALAETIIGFYKTEVVERRGPWRRFEDVEMTTLEGVDWFNDRRLLGPIGNIPPAEAEAAFNAQLAGEKIAA